MANLQESALRLRLFHFLLFHDYGDPLKPKARDPAPRRSLYNEGDVECTAGPAEKFRKWTTPGNELVSAKEEALHMSRLSSCTLHCFMQVRKLPITPGC
mmetsp:Transcript_44864/g.74636  ORF Transcript_44864/g.74636 Transcript_44864/m.74636 type:complete len:99 (+) Transcript_44864:444-740(+)